MVTEFEATPKAIQTLWNLPGFVHRQANLERREVVSLATFQDYMDKLQLMQLLGCPVRKTYFLRHLYIKTIIFPRQARDKHRENSKRVRFSQENEPDPWGSEAPDEDETKGHHMWCLRLCVCRRCCIGSDGKVRMKEKRVKENYCLRERQVRNVLSRWDAIITLLLLWVTATVPVRIGFNLPTDAWSLWFFFDLITDLCFITDIVLNFSMAYKKDGLEDHWVDNADMVHKRYMFDDNAWHGAGSFWIDLLSCVPVTYIYLIVGAQVAANNQKFFRLFRLMRLTRLIRLLKIQNVLKRNTENLRNADWMAVVKSALGTLVGAHILACAWHMVAIAGCDATIDSTCVAGLDSWIDAYDERLIDQSLWHRYVASLYFATTTLSTVGYGDILPTNTAERAFVILCQIIGVVAFGYTMGTLGAYIIEGDNDARLQHYNDVMPRIDKYLEHKKVTKRRREEIKQKLGHVLMYSPEYSVEKEDDVLEQMRLIDAVTERETVLDVYYKQSVPKLFRVYDAGSEEVLDLGHLLEPIYNKDGERDFEPFSIGEDGAITEEMGEIIIEEGKVAQGIYVIERGRCKEIVGGGSAKEKEKEKDDNNDDDPDGNEPDEEVEHMELLGEGDCFGEIAAMGFGGGNDGRRNTRTVRAATEEQKLQRAFQRLDRDGSGSIDRAELKLGARFLGIEATEEELDEMMSKADEDGRDGMDYEEFRGFFQDNLGMKHTEKVQLKFLSIDKLQKLFAKYPSMETTLWMQISLRRTREINEQKRKKLQKLNFPQTEEESNALFDKIYRDPNNRGADISTPRAAATAAVAAAHGADSDGGGGGGDDEDAHTDAASAGEGSPLKKKTVTFAAVLSELEDYSEHLPISPELPYEDRERMIKETFDVDNSDTVDSEELWTGIQDFRGNPTRFRPPIQPTEQSMPALVGEQTRLMESMENRLASSLGSRLGQVEETQAQILTMLSDMQRQLSSMNQ